ncbi:Hypothetical protein AA314_03005 [Archangium gephyra]|uniref:Uncharacterized protein n=1 Tax=Archangium gephyra TaxID=48 RepID=A0AAC8Q5K2_9BACT|nr:Hypothetical protein AA314_03005 [Archangium gephyra]
MRVDARVHLAGAGEHSPQCMRPPPGLQGFRKGRFHVRRAGR